MILFERPEQGYDYENYNQHIRSKYLKRMLSHFFSKRFSSAARRNSNDLPSNEGYFLITMATRNALRIVSRRFSSGRVLSEEEKAAKNVFIKKMEQEKLAKIARQGPAEQAASGAKLPRIRRFYSGKVLSKEESAAENVFIKKRCERVMMLRWRRESRQGHKMEQEKLEKIARQLEKISRQLTQVVEGPGEQAAAGSASGANASGTTSTALVESGPKVSEDKVLSEEERAGGGLIMLVVTGLFIWWLFKPRAKKQPEVQEYKKR